MFGKDGGSGREVGDGAGDFDYAGVGAGGQAEAVDEGLEEVAAGGVEGAEAVELLRAHLGVGENGRAGKTLLLDLPGAEDPRRHCSSRLRLPATHQLPGVHGSHK